MAENKRIDIIKGAIILEHRGKALYESVVNTAASRAVRELFDFLTKEEEIHIEILNKQYGLVSSGQEPEIGRAGAIDSRIADKVLSKDIVSSISGAGYEAAVIAAALDFEKKAVDFYTGHAEKAGSPGEKNLYHWFSEWEKGHMVLLAKLDNEIKEKIWYDNSFWPLG